MRLLNLVLLLLIALVLAAGNLWIAAARSTIPLELSDTAIAVEVRREKHPGHDDVYLLRMQSGKSLHVDEAIAKAIITPADLKKPAWSRQLLVDGANVRLDWSTDLRGLAWVMPGALLVIAATAGWVWTARRGRESLACSTSP